MSHHVVNGMPNHGKGDEDKSGGLVTNIGIHFFDMLQYLFGEQEKMEVHLKEPDRVAGTMQLPGAKVCWFLSTRLQDVPEKLRREGQRTYRSIHIEGEELEFSGGFTDLHTESYRKILIGEGFGLGANRAAIEAVAAIRGAQTTKVTDDCHPFMVSTE